MVIATRQLLSHHLIFLSIPRQQSLEAIDKSVRVASHHEDDGYDHHPKQNGVQDRRVTQCTCRIDEDRFQVAIWVSDGFSRRSLNIVLAIQEFIHRSVTVFDRLYHFPLLA